METMIRVDERTYTERSLTALLQRAQRQARALGRPVLVSHTEPAPSRDPLDLFARAAAIAPDRHLWAQPAAGFALAGAGAAHVIEPRGANRFARAAASWRDLLAAAILSGQAATMPGAGPVLLGGFAFDPERPATPTWDGFPDARLVLPRFLYRSHADEHWLTVNTLVWPDSDPDAAAEDLAQGREWVRGEALTPDDWGRGERRGAVDCAHLPSPLSQRLGEGSGVRAVLPPSQWQATVARAAAAVRRGALEKVVLARAVRLRGDAPFDVAGALGRLRETYPTCTLFAVARGERVFLGATPERLVRLDQGTVQVASLAGSMPRGATPEEDERLGAALLAGAKDRIEHAIVVEAIRAALDGLCDHLTVPDEPVLLSVRNVHHLYTPITGRVRPGATLLDLVAALHPTPAVGGVPREEALGFIRAHERLDRGWYAAPVGWLGVDGGEFAVALRSALVAGGGATLFAGCGIVGDSDPAQEYAESEVKLRPMLGALGAVAE